MVLTDLDKGIIIGYRECGRTYKELQERLGHAISTIADFYSEYQKSGKVERKAGSGRKRKTTDRQDTDIVIAAKRRRTITATEIKQDLDIPVSDQTIRNRLNEKGFYSFFAIKKPFISEDNRRKRLEFANKHKDKPLSFWNSILWSDESPFVLRFSGRDRVWRLPNERYASYCLHGTVKHDKKINVWGCFSAQGVGRLYRINGILEKHQFHSILVNQMIPSAKKLFPSGQFSFQQDNDPKHTAIINQRYLKNKNVSVLEWPSQSPDLNPIENLWAYMDRQMKNRHPQNEDELFVIVKECWESLSIEILKAHVDSMPRRCQAVIESNGMPTKY